MSEKKSTSPDAGPVAALPAESQSDRWIKYGSNVGLSVILVLVLAVMLTYFAQRVGARKDTTVGGSMSLKPQSVNVIKDLKGHITLVSLYANPDNDPEKADQAQRVADLLDEYKNKSDKIDVKVIDPQKEKDKLEDLHVDFVTRYGSQIKSYKDYLDDWNKQYEKLKKLTDAEAKAVEQFGSGNLGNGPESDTSDFARTIGDEMPAELRRAKQAVDHELKQKHPDYKGAVNAVKSRLDLLSQVAAQIIEQAPVWEQSPKIPEQFKKYISAAVPNYQQIKQIVDDEVAKAGKLGELKIDKLEQALNVENPILVLGDDDWRILPQTQIWQPDTDLRGMAGGAKPKPLFAGEQNVTTAILSLEQPKKQKVCIVRGGGAPLTSPAFPPISRGGPLSFLAEHLRQYNFEVTEKDLSGQWAARAQMQQMPSAPEPSDEQIKDAIWIVLDLPQGQEQGPQPSPIAPRLKEHLEQGGSALLLVESRADALLEPLKGWGVELHPEALAVHEQVKLTDAADADWIEQVLAQPAVWDCRNYGQHPLAKPIQTLDSAIVAPIVVRTTSAPDCTITPLLPLSANMPGVKTWGATEIETQKSGPPEYHPEKGDLAPPIFAGAVVEKKGAGRLVVIGSVQSFTNMLMQLADPKLARRDPAIIVNRFPGNAELATNSVFWLAHMDTMIAISPSAMDVSRLSDMSSGTLGMWHLMMLVLLPALVLAAGVTVYMVRRD